MKKLHCPEGCDLSIADVFTVGSGILQDQKGHRFYPEDCFCEGQKVSGQLILHAFRFLLDRITQLHIKSTTESMEVWGEYAGR